MLIKFSYTTKFEKSKKNSLLKKIFSESGGCDMGMKMWRKHISCERLGSEIALNLLSEQKLWCLNSVVLCLLKQEYSNGEGIYSFFMIYMKWTLKKYLSDRFNVTLFQLTLLDGLKSVLESIKKNHSKVKGKCENFSKIWCRKCPI